MTLKYKKYLDELSSRHPKFKKLIEIVGPINRRPGFRTLNDAVFYAIVGQMLSVHAARSIIKRLKDRFITSENVIRWAMKNQPEVGLTMGLSRNKMRALGEWGRFVKKNKDVAIYWRKLPFKEYKNDVIKIWGLGSWSADMIAIFHFGKMDVWPHTDAGIQRACRLMFGTSDYKKIGKFVNGCETVACLYLWEMLDKKIVL